MSQWRKLFRTSHDSRAIGYRFLNTLHLIAPISLLIACGNSPSPLAPNFSGSIGWPYGGVQTSAIELPVSGEGFTRFRPNGEWYWGQPALVEGIQAAAAQVASERPGGADLVLGDLSAETGGHILRHNSHRSGRDIDLLWYFKDLKGNPVQAPGFIHVGSDALARTEDNSSFLMLDIERQWLIVKALLESEHFEVMWLFCSKPIKRLLIIHAIARHEDLDLIARASQVLMQPSDSLSHDDHLHLRIACPPGQKAQGCSGGGPEWPWLANYDYPGIDDEFLRKIEQESPLLELEAQPISPASSEEMPQEQRLSSYF